jgi:hypothetical protein
MYPVRGDMIRIETNERSAREINLRSRRAGAEAEHSRAVLQARWTEAEQPGCAAPAARPERRLRLRLGWVRSA